MVCRFICILISSYILIPESLRNILRTGLAKDVVVLDPGDQDALYLEIVINDEEKRYRFQVPGKTRIHTHLRG